MPLETPLCLLSSIYPTAMFSLTIFWFYLLPIAVLAASSGSSCSSSGTTYTVVTTPQDITSTGIDKCAEWDGNLSLGLAWWDLDLPNLKRIHGSLLISGSTSLSRPKNLTVSASGLFYLTLGNLSRIDGDLDIEGIQNQGPGQNIENPGFVQLGSSSEDDTRTGPKSSGTTVGGTTTINSCTLDSIVILLEETDTFVITDNHDPYGTQVPSFDPTTPWNWPLSVNELRLYGNTLTLDGNLDKNSDNVFFDLGYQNVGRKVFFQGSQSPFRTFNIGVYTVLFSGLHMPLLQWVPELEVRNATSSDFSSLAYVNHSLTLDTIRMDTINIPKLKSVGSGGNSSLLLTNSLLVQHVTMPELEIINGTLNFTGNNALFNITALPKLRTVLGDFFLQGPLWNVELPSLERVEGNFMINSTQPLNCTPFNELRLEKNFVGGDYQCIGQIDPGYYPAGYTKPLKPTKSRTVLIAGIAGGVSGGVLLLAVGWYYYRRRPRKLPDLIPGIANPELEDNEAKVYEVDAKTNEIMAEATGVIPRTELHGDFAPVELFVSDTIPAELYGSEPEPVFSNRHDGIERMRAPSPTYARRGSQRSLLAPSVLADTITSSTPSTQGSSAVSLRRDRSQTRQDGASGSSEGNAHAGRFSWSPNDDGVWGARPF
ncbi:hypothetical protein TWF694_003284 [Orbilia ellipsospora]|uniref:Receptor L-domain domain-containing protein n=1 Tax=Orbilia ellipsospora TaxID=2528407 RepID=A0AAV9X152_9PEZI